MVNKTEVFLNIAKEFSRLSSCKSRKVGAVLIKNDMIISTGYNGTPKGILNCNKGGCLRCNNKDRIIGKLDNCICVHAEMNCILQAAYNGINTKNSIIISTLKPCNDCIKNLINAGVTEIIYKEDYPIQIFKIFHEKIKLTKY